MYTNSAPLLSPLKIFPVYIIVGKAKSSVTVDFPRKPKVMLEDDEIQSINDLMDKCATDEEHRLTS